MADLTVEKMSPEDAPAVARLDRENRGDDFLPSLGEGFLGSLYAGFLSSGAAFGFVVRDGDRIAAFIIGTGETGRLFRTALRRHWPVLGWRALPRLLARPALIGKTFQTLAYPSRSSLPEGAELIVMGTGRGYRRRGLGSKLIAALNREFSRRGVAAYKVTVKENNPSANEFYRAAGFEPRGDFRLYGELWNLYLRRIPEGSGPAPE